ncbi:MAG: ATP-NAD kinase family protein [Candidatus Altiarchaeota archaeon]|nr:ATP-NAD kinase family protein [Candidatus Altiarchaeota archaeon]
MGGAVGLKGTDGKVDEALKLGANPVAWERADEFLGKLDKRAMILTASGDMGETLLDGFKYKVVYSAEKPTTSEDTIGACTRFLQEKVDLIIFCGGDGTARDVYSAVGDRIPVVGVPAGVKMHSAVFAVNPHTAAEVVNEYIKKRLPLKDAEVMDVDEDAYRRNVLKTCFFGYMKVPYKPQMMQAGKQVYASEDEDIAKRDISLFAKQFMYDGSTYILGAGTTTAAIAAMQRIDKTLLGVDIIREGTLVAKDVSEKEILKVLEGTDKAKIIVSPIGAQGFVFGRGTQQISPKVIRKVGVKNIIYVSTPHKLNSVPYLLVDSGDQKLDDEIAGYESVVIGYQIAQKKDIKTL